MIQLDARHESWPLRSSFSISRGSKTSVDVIVVELGESGIRGHGEAVPYPRYDQTIEQTIDSIHEVAQDIRNGISRNELIEILPANAARNALDCAMWDFEAKRSKQPAWKIAGLPKPKPVVGAYTISMGDPDSMAQAARKARQFPLLKLKLGVAAVAESVTAVRNACPGSRLVVDANEAWDIDQLDELMPQLAELRIEAIEQPLPAGKDEELATRDYPIPLCADESFFDSAELDSLSGHYQIFNIKIDKTGGLTHAIRTAAAIRQSGKEIMIGSMMATSLALAPAMLLAYNAAIVDLDSPLWLTSDRAGGIRYENGVFLPAERTLWG